VNNTYIYCLIDPITKEVRYIGKSNNPNQRLVEHIKYSKYNSYKDNWIFGLKNKGLFPELFILDEVIQDEWSFWEKYYISLYKSWGFKLTNLTEGGDGNSLVSENMRNKISNGLKSYYQKNPSTRKNKTFVDLFGEERANEIISKIILAKNGIKIHTEEHKLNLSNKMSGNQYTKGRKLSEEHKKRISEKSKGRKVTDEVKKKISKKNSGDKNGMYGKKHTKDSLQKISDNSKGENHSMSKIKESDVLLIREYHKNKTYNQKEISKLFNISYSLVNKIVYRVLWKHI
jgi:hypothetical protein